MKPFRQGQTLYYIDNGWINNTAPAVVAVFLHSQKTQLPPLGCIVEKMPVTRARVAASRGMVFYRSRRKALRAMLRLANNRYT
jgi:hypothetical protein